MTAVAPDYPNPPRRRDLAVKHATKAALQSIYFTNSLSRWGEGPRDLSARARRALRFFCALHRAGAIGYVGTRAPLAAIVEAMRRANDDEAASVTTLKRQLKELAARGYIITSEGYESGVREIAPHEWIRSKVVVVTLTEKARAIWSLPTSAHGGPNCTGYDFPEAPLGLDKGSSAPAIVVASPDDNKAIATPSEEPLRGDVSPHDRAETPSRDRSPAAVVVEAPHSRPIAPRDKRADGDRIERTSQAACQDPASTTRPRPRPRGVPPRNRRMVMAALLETIAAVVYGRDRVEKAVRARAALEIAGGTTVDPSGVDWDYWLSVWPVLPRRERRFWAQTEIVPLLAAPFRSSSGSSSSSSPASNAQASASSSSSSPASNAQASASSSSSSSSSASNAQASASASSSSVADPEIDPRNPFLANLARILERLKK
ncbi:MAG: hypothetical protein ABFD60_11215 [Bryobacteraceae bacterium]